MKEHPDPRVNAHFQLGLQLGNEKKWPEAIHAFLGCLRIDAQYVDAWYNLMCCHIQNGEKEKGLGAGQRAMQIDPKFPNLTYCLANLTLEMDRISDSAEYLMRTIEANPQQMDCHILLGNIFEKLRLFEESYECFANALKLGGERSTLYSAMIYQAGHAGRFDLAHVAKLGLKREFEAKRNHAAPFQLFCYEDATREDMLAAARMHWKKSGAGAIAPLP